MCYNSKLIKTITYPEEVFITYGKIMSLKVRKRLKRLLKILVLITAVLVLTFVIMWFLFPFPEERLEQ